GDPDPGWAPISWDEALELTASCLLAVKARFGPEAVVFAHGTPSGSATSDAVRWLQRWPTALGGPNLMSSIHICNWNRTYGSQYTYGVPTPAPDYDKSPCIFLCGFYPPPSCAPGAS